MNIDLLKNQHLSIRELVHEIELGINSENVAEQAFHLSLKISQLSGVLGLHLKAEDEYLYPTLERSKNENIPKIAQQFSREMRNLSAKFMEYKQTYMIASNIKAEPQKFAAESKTIISALTNRLNIEDQKLYPLL